MLVTFEEPPYAIKVTALAPPPLPCSFLARPPRPLFIMLPSPTAAPASRSLSPAASHPSPARERQRGGSFWPTAVPSRSGSAWQRRRYDQHGRHFPSAA